MCYLLILSRCPWILLVSDYHLILSCLCAFLFCVLFCCCLVNNYLYYVFSPYSGLFTLFISWFCSVIEHCYSVFSSDIVLSMCIVILCSRQILPCPICLSLDSGLTMNIVILCFSRFYFISPYYSNRFVIMWMSIYLQIFLVSQNCCVVLISCSWFLSCLIITIKWGKPHCRYRELK